MELGFELPWFRGCWRVLLTAAGRSRPNTSTLRLHGDGDAAARENVNTPSTPETVMLIVSPLTVIAAVLSPSGSYRPAPGRQSRVEYYCRSTRGFSLHNRVKSLRSRPPPQCPANGRLTNRRENPRACTPLGRSPTTLPITCAGTNGRPCLWVIRCYVITGPRGGSAPTTNSLNRRCPRPTGSSAAVDAPDP